MPPAKEGFVIIAHRGDSSAAPENTTPAFDLAVAQGFHHFETDCQLSADGVPVILHDQTLGRVNNGSGPAAAATLQQLQQLDAGSWFGPQFAGTCIPTLQEVLVKYRGRVHMHLVSRQRSQPGRNNMQGRPETSTLIAGCQSITAVLLLHVLQELKSQQQALPAAVAALVRKLHWLPAQLQEAAGTVQQPPPPPVAAAVTATCQLNGASARANGHTRPPAATAGVKAGGQGQQADKVQERTAPAFSRTSALVCATQLASLGLGQQQQQQMARQCRQCSATHSGLCIAAVAAVVAAAARGTSRLVDPGGDASHHQHSTAGRV